MLPMVKMRSPLSPSGQIVGLSIIVVITISGVCLTEQKIANVYKNDVSNFQKLVLHEETRTMFLGAQNKLYRLSLDLTWQQEVSLGPAMDSHLCLNPKHECMYELKLRDEQVKLLLVSPEGDELLVCGNLYQGSCAKVAAHNITQLTWAYEPVVGVASDTVFSSTAAVVTKDDELFVANSVNTHANIQDGNPLGTTRPTAPFLATRNYSTLEIRYRTGYVSSQMNIDPSIMFRAIHKFAFTYNDSAYFLVTRESEQNSDEAAAFISRTCQTDTAYHSYVEAQLSCNIDGIQFNFVEDAYVGTPGRRLAAALRIPDNEKLLFVTFSNIEKSRWDRGRHSGLCAYRLTDIHRKLTQSIQKCFRGQGSTGPYHLARPFPCTFTNFPIQDDYCGEYSQNFPIASNEVMTPIISRTFANTHLSAVTVSTVGPYTVVYLGTRSGKLLKVDVDSASNITLYESIPIHPGNAILPDMLLSSDGTSLYTMTSSIVARVEVQDCGSHAICETCMTSADPHCGWCSISKRCTAEDDCQAGTLGWSKTRTGRCPAIISAQPNLTHAGTPIKVRLILTAAPPHPDSTTCAVRVPGGSIDGEVVLINDKTLECKSTMTWPQLPEHIVSQKLMVDVVVKGQAWLSTNVTVYDCTRHHNCSECVTSSNPCAWCILSSRCTDAHSVALIENCGFEAFIYNNNFAGQSSGQSSGRGASFCPRIKQLGSNEPLLHSGIRGTVKVAGVQLPPEISTQPMTCRFQRTEVSAVVTPSNGGVHNITCPGVVLSYKKDVPFTSVPLSVLWGEPKTALDNPHNLQLKLYDCKHMATSCGQCLTLDAHFQCGQCEGDCSRQEKCPTTWHNRTYVCPNPLITRVQPLFGPLGGGTLLTIHGINLGQVKRHVEGGVTVGGHPCTIKDYSPSTSIVCLTSAVQRSKEARIAVTVAGHFTTQASSLFGYVDPVVESMTPLRGPLAGGTNVTLTGRHLNVGASLQVELRETRVKRKPGPSSMGKSVSATVHRRTNESVEFETQQMEGGRPTSLKVVVTVDGNQFSNDNLIFSYAENPTITKVEPVVTLQSGGTLVTVRGSSLDLVQKPRLIVYSTEREPVTSCDLLPNQTDVMTCLTPELNDLDLNKGQSVTLNYGFIMDNVTQLLNVSGSGGADLQPLHLYPDPVLDPLPKDTEYDLEQPLTLTGLHLGVLAHFSDFTVTVGGPLCNITTINDTVIICQPTAQPEWLNDGKAQVLLEIQNHQTSPGWLLVKGSQPFTMGLPFILAIVAIAIVFISFILTICLCRRCHEERKKNEQQLAVNEDPAAIPLTRIMTPKEESAVVADMVASVKATPTEATPLTEVDGGGEKQPEENGDPSGARNSYVSFIGDDAMMLKSLLKDMIDPKLQEMIQDVLIPRAYLTLGDVLGKGHFGCVYSGMLQVPETEEEPVKVAVKTLQGRTLDREAVESFLREGVMMKNFDHPHVLRLLGVSVTDQGENPLVILPFMAAGDLRNYVKNKKKSFTARQLLQLGQQVAEGMAYLAQRGFIHRDLAARNCMVDETSQVKVADFGLSKDLYEKDYYSSVDRKRKMPIKWMALESLEDYVFTTKSDVWSFGVLLWELMIRGVTPYPDVDAFEMRNYLASGRRLRQPKFCPDNAYILMAECWRTNPDDRPTFADLVNRLELMVNPPRRSSSDIIGDEPLYVNIQRQPSLQNELEPEET